MKTANEVKENQDGDYLEIKEHHYHLISRFRSETGGNISYSRFCQTKKLNV